MSIEHELASALNLKDLISEFAKRSDKLGALIAALPMITVLAMTWMFFELKGQEQTEKIANHAYYTFWYVIPTMPMFLLTLGDCLALPLGMHIRVRDVPISSAVAADADASTDAWRMPCGHVVYFIQIPSALFPSSGVLHKSNDFAPRI